MHKISAASLELWMSDKWHLYASEKSARLFVSFFGTFRVIDKTGKLIYYGSDMNRAVDLFNENIW